MRQIHIINIMLPANSEKKNLIQAMKKLTYQISNNPQRQKEIFDSLASNDLIKIVQHLYDDNEYLRRISALLLCELFYSNKQLKLAMSDKLSLPFTYGRICINRIPDYLFKTPSQIKKCIQLMKSPLRKGEDEMFCWIINLDKKNLEIQFFQYKKYSSFTFLDPQRAIFGFTILDPDYEQHIPLSPATKNVQVQSKQGEKQIQTDRADKQYPSKRYSIGGKFEAFRPNSSLTSRQKQIYLSFSKQKSDALVKTINQARSHVVNPVYNNNSNSDSKQRTGTSIQSISQYARNSYGKQSTIYDKKQKQRFSLSFTNNDQKFGSISSQTDRYELKNKGQLEPSGTKGKVTTKTPQNHHQNFYKRVQQILRK